MNITECLNYSSDFEEYLPSPISDAWENGFPYRCYVVKDGDAVMGFALFDLAAVRRVACLSYLYVHPKYRGNNLGEELLEEVYKSLFEKGYDKIYASLLGDETTIKDKRLYLERQNFNPITTRSYLTYLIESINGSEVYSKISANPSLSSSVVSVNQAENKEELLHQLAKMGIFAEEDMEICVVLKGTEVIGAMTSVVNDGNEIMVLESIVPMDKNKGRIMVIMLVAIVKTWLEKNPGIDCVRVLCQDAATKKSCEKCFGESIDTLYREEWLLKFVED